MPILLVLSVVPVPRAGADPADTAVATIGDDGAPVVIDVYEDYLCPYSAAFEQEFGARLIEAAASGKLSVRYHMLRFLDPRSASGDYSSRAAGAALALFERDPEDFAPLHQRLFAQETQPKEHGKSDLSNEQLAKIADDLGADPGAVSAIADGAQTAAAEDLAEQSADELRQSTGQVSVPTVVKDGKPVDVDDKNWLRKLLG
ncbi:DsbA family protein [Segniliparus rotundus]|nr:thioredoxin domain-containing protein [Segniliparus rotundus]